MVLLALLVLVVGSLKIKISSKKEKKEKNIPEPKRHVVDASLGPFFRVVHRGGGHSGGGRSFVIQLALALAYT